MKKFIRICADDYGLAPGVSDAIRALISARRINATSVMTVFADLAAEAGLLLPITADRSTSVGLHLTLTGGFRPLRAAPFGDDMLPELSRLIRRSFQGRLDPAAVAAEVEAQFAAFEAAFGRPPDHVDGHQHVHVLPGIRAIVLEATRRHAPRAWVRDCTMARRARLGFDAKGRLIGAFSLGMARDAARAGLDVNSGFAGAYDFASGVDFASLLARSVAALPAGGVLMVHPGRVDNVLLVRDPLTDQREVELAVLQGPALPTLLTQAGASLAPAG